MKITIQVSEKTKKFMAVNWSDVIQRGLTKVTLMVQNRAKELAPYQTWTLRRSITSDFVKIRQGISIVWSPVPYARRRHYENKKNPQTLRYLERGYTEQIEEIKRVFLQTLQQAI